MRFADKWSPVFMLAFLAFVGPGAIEGALDQRTWWKITVAVTWALLVVIQVGILVGRYARRNRPKPPIVEPVDPTSVSDDEVASAVAESSSRVSAVKLLRERRPGLGLKDAVDLIDGK